MAHPIFTQHILTAFNLDHLPEDQQDMLMAKMGEVAEGRVILRIVSGLNDEQKKTFDVLLDGEDDDALQSFFEVHVPDMLLIIEEESQKLKNELLQRIGKA